MSILEQIRRETRKAGLSTYMLAKRAGIRVSGVQDIIKGGDAYTATAEKLAAALGFKVTLEPIRKGGAE